MQTSDILSIIALGMTFVSIAYTVFIDLRNRNYARTQDALNHRLLEKEKEELIKQQAAEVNATIYEEGKKYILRIFNKGNSAAKNVRWKLVGNNPQWFIRDQYFPMSLLHPRQSVDIYVLIAAQSSPKAEILIEWDDNIKTDNTWQGILTI